MATENAEILVLDHGDRTVKDSVVQKIKLNGKFPDSSISIKIEIEGPKGEVEKKFYKFPHMAHESTWGIELSTIIIPTIPVVKTANTGIANLGVVPAKDDSLDAMINKIGEAADSAE